MTEKCLPPNSGPKGGLSSVKLEKARKRGGGVVLTTPMTWEED